MEMQPDNPDYTDSVVIISEKPKNTWGWRLLVMAIAALGGVLGILGAIIQEIQQASLLATFIAAPMIEESMKPAGVYFVLVKWPEALTSRRYTALLAAIGGLTFAVVENVVYLQLYFPDYTPEMAVYRYTVCLGMHVVCSFIFGFGIHRRLLSSMKGEVPFLQGSKRYFIPAMVLHGLYNIAAVFIIDADRLTNVVGLG